MSNAAQTLSEDAVALFNVEGLSREAALNYLALGEYISSFLPDPYSQAAIQAIQYSHQGIEIFERAYSEGATHAEPYFQRSLLEPYFIRGLHPQSDKR